MHAWMIRVSEIEFT